MRIARVGLGYMKRNLTMRSYFGSIRFTKEHEWVEYDETQKIGKVGISDFAQNELGDIVFLKMPEVNSQVKLKDQIGEIESVKAVANLYTPISGQIVEVNKGLESDYGVINKVEARD